MTMLSMGPWLLLAAIFLLAVYEELRRHRGQKAGALGVRVYTHNLRYATAAPFTGEEPWPVRKPRSIAEARYHTHGIPGALICLQEVLHLQLLDFLDGLNATAAATTSEQQDKKHEWAYVGVGRDDGQKRGEYSPIFFRPSVYELLSWETVWLSPNPTIPSKGWDAGSIRILTVAVLRHRESNKVLLVLNTHLDDRSSLAREKGAQVILAAIAKYLPSEHSTNLNPAVKALLSEQRKPTYTGKVDAVVLSGDLNSQSHQEAYQVLTSSHSPLVDVHGLVPPSEQYGNSATFTGFSPSDEPSRIDYILAGPRALGPEAKRTQGYQEVTTDSRPSAGPWHVDGYAVLPNRFDDGIYNSDHRAVVVDLEL